MPEPGKRKRLRPPKAAPTVFQLEAAECGAASLAMILGYYGRHVPLETLRQECGVSRDGSKASNILKAARSYGLEAKGLKAEPAHIETLTAPMIAFVDFCHFVVVEGVWRDRVYINDPASGRRRISMAEFDARFTGVVLTFRPTEAFEAGDDRPSLMASLKRRAAGAERAVLFVLLAGLALVLPGVALPILSSIFVDYVLVRGLEDWLAPLLIGLVLTAVVRMALIELRDWTLSRAETRLAVDGASALYRHILRLPIAYFGVRYAGEIVTRLGLSDGLARLLSNDVANVALNFIQAAFFMALMLVYDATLTGVVVLMGAINLMIVIHFAKVVSDGHRKLSIDSGKLVGVELSGVQDIETLKAAGAEEAFFRRWSGLQANLISAEQEMGRRLILVRATPSLLSALTTATVLTLGGASVMSGDMTIGSLVAFQTLAASFTAPVIALTGLGASLQEVKSFTERTEDVLRQPVAQPGGAGPVERLPAGHIEIRDLAFGYAPLDPPLISGFDLNLPAGGSVALIGASGSGKSTIGRLIAGLYEPTAGEILIDGAPASAWPKAALAAAIAYIDQEITLFEGTVRENLTLWDDTAPDTVIVRAAHDAAIHDVISARPGSYDGGIDEGGRNFSGGQRQRLEIARALAADPRIVVMDEGTSALDAETEIEILQNIKARNVTLVIIAHRLSTIRDCDEIIVLDRGQIVERGGHAELIERRGRYAALLES